MTATLMEGFERNGDFSPITTGSQLPKGPTKYLCTGNCCNQAFALAIPSMSAIDSMTMSAPAPE